MNQDPNEPSATATGAGEGTTLEELEQDIASFLEKLENVQGDGAAEVHGYVDRKMIYG